MENQNKFTPAPWVVTKFTGTYGGPDTWGVRLSNNTGITPMLEANARLISAAPELLTALQSVIQIIENYTGDMPACIEADLYGPMKDAYAACKKATGGDL